ncbi:hypothetical protein Taro_026593 [Colocasia esculenta]|uniref:Disease resistance R13L4/SHOC-2-like LRR domain-containing protein n=1 Tax=Colocasia esculenta TaxID=4460 RepID=A0A843VRR4_COLES|nr:hypothetical protein [Colocasia esculenta]
MAVAPPQGPAPAVVAAVDEIMRTYRSLPPPPSIEEVEAAEAVIRGADAEEQARLDELARQEKPSELPDELFFVLQEVRRGAVRLLAAEQRAEALRVVDLDERFQVLGELIQRASRLVSPDGDGGGGMEVEKVPPVALGIRVAGGRTEKKVSLGGGASLARVEEEEEESAAFQDVPKALLRTSSLESGLPSVYADGEPQKFSLIKVAGVIETAAKSETRVLDLRGKLMDQIEWLPTSLGKLTNITELDLSENQIMALPTTIASLKFLTKLDIHSNKLINLPDNFGELSSLTDLDLHANSLKSLPPSFGNLTALVNLDLSSNRFTALPDTLGNLTKLRKLDVETNELEELPYTIGSCTSLVELRLDFNQIRALPEAVGKLESLEIITLHYNRIKGLPTTMASLVKLRELDVSFNELGTIPESLCFATSLVKLNVSNNFADLTALPKSIGNLELLEELDISNDQIRILPESFRFLSNLRWFRADETPLEVPPKNVAKLGAQAVVQYMADLVEPKEVIHQSIERKGFWYWLCSLFQPRRNGETSVSITVPAAILPMQSRIVIKLCKSQEGRGRCSFEFFLELWIQEVLVLPPKLLVDSKRWAFSS